MKKVNFIKDYIELLELDLKNSNIDYDVDLPQSNPTVFIAKYYEFQLRKLSSIPRKVKCSSELKSSSKFISYSGPINNLISLFEKGENVNPYQSRDIGNFTPRPGREDMLLMDWGIHHFHLGSLQPGQELSDGTSDLLFGFFTNDTAYLLEIFDHSSFSEKELLEIIDSNWPTVLQSFEIKGFDEINDVAKTNEDIRKLRKAGVQPHIKLRSGKIIILSGGGYTTAKSSLTCMIKAQNASKQLRAIESQVTQNSDEIAEKMGADKINLDFHLKSIDNEEIVITDKISGKDWQLFFRDI